MIQPRSNCSDDAIVYDTLESVLHLLGIDRRLTDVHGHVIPAILA